MPLPGIVRVVAAALLAVPSGAAAQSDVSPTDTRAPAAPRPVTRGNDAGGVEIGLGSTLIVIFPTVGGQVSVPAGRGLRVEGSVHVLPHLGLLVDDVVLLLQGQVRVPAGGGATGPRRGLLLGATTFAVASGFDGPGEWARGAWVRPHVGYSWQWRTRPRMDVRLDLHAVLLGDAAPGVAPLATVALVWRGRRRSG
jgi:hypothetical protein